MALDRQAVYTATAVLRAALENIQSDAAADSEEKGRLYREHSGALTELARSIQLLHLSTSADLSVIAFPTNHAYLAQNIKILRESMEIMEAESARLQLSN